MESTYKSHIEVKVYDSEHDVALLRITSNLGNVTELVVDGQSLKDWMQGELIQRCFPELDVVTRELMISGMDPITQMEIFGSEEES